MDASGLVLGRVRSLIGFTDSSGLRMARGEERDVELTGPTLSLVDLGVLEVLETYLDPSAEAWGHPEEPSGQNGVADGAGYML